MKYFVKLKNNWDKFAIKDPLWAILTDDNKKGNKWEKEEFFNSGKKEIDNLLAQIETNGIRINFDKAMDFGCGVGRLTQTLGEYFNNVIGFDISPKMIELANEYNKKRNCRYNVCDLINIKKKQSNEFDFIYSNITLQHIQPKYVYSYLEEFQRILKNNGIIVFQLAHKFKNPFIRILRENVFLYNLYLKIRFIGWEKMETYCIRKEKLLNFMKSLSFELLLLEKDSKAGPKWESYTYYFKKNK